MKIVSESSNQCVCLLGFSCSQGLSRFVRTRAANQRRLHGAARGFESLQRLLRDDHR